MPWPTQEQVDAYTAQRAPLYGIDPLAALTVRRGESSTGYVGDQGLSYGPFQLRFAGVLNGRQLGPGLAESFMAETGLDPRNPDTWREQVDWSLKHASKHSWSAWSAAIKAFGPDNLWAGINQAFDPGQLPDPLAPVESGMQTAYEGINSYVHNHAVSLVILGGSLFLILVGLFRMFAGTNAGKTVISMAGGRALGPVGAIGAAVASDVAGA